MLYAFCDCNQAGFHVCFCEAQHDLDSFVNSNHNSLGVFDTRNEFGQICSGSDTPDYSGQHGVVLYGGKRIDVGDYGIREGFHHLVGESWG